MPPPNSAEALARASGKERCLYELHTQTQLESRLHNNTRTSYVRTTQSTNLRECRENDTVYRERDVRTRQLGIVPAGAPHRIACIRERGAEPEQN